MLVSDMKSFMFKPFVAGTVFLLYICGSTADESSYGNGMCSRTVSNVVYRQHQYSKTYSCWSLWSFRCRRDISKKLSFTVYSRETSVCCLGYRKTDDGLCEPYCDNCTNPKKCIKPNTCVCPKGWSGQNCTEDIDECKIENGGCQHICKNTLGSYTCSCMQQYLLTDDKHNCTVLNEISSGSQSGMSTTIIGGVAGVLVLLLLLIVTVIIVVLIYKVVKRKNNLPHFMISEYERDYHNEIYGTIDRDVYQAEDQLSSGYTEISGEGRMQPFSTVTRKSNVSLGKSNAKFKDKDGYLHLTRF